MSLRTSLDLAFAVVLVFFSMRLLVSIVRTTTAEIAQQRTSRRPQEGDEERLERLWTQLRPLLAPGRPVPVVALADGPTSTAMCWPGRRPRLVFRRTLLDEPSAEAMCGEVAHEYSHTFKPPIAFIFLAILAVVLGAELVGSAMTWSPDAPLTNLLIPCIFASTGAGYAVNARLSQREELRADRQAAELLGSARPVIAMLEQLRADCRARGIDPDRWRLSDRLGASHPPVEVRIRALGQTRDRDQEPKLRGRTGR